MFATFMKIKTKTGLSRLSLVLGGALLVMASLAPKVGATGDAYFSLSPTSGNETVNTNFTVQISVTASSADNMNAIQANLSYDPTVQYVSTTLNGPFTICPQNTGGNGVVNIACASPTDESGTQNIAYVTFNAKTAGAANIKMASQSDIDSDNGSSVFNGNLPATSLTVVNASSSGGTGGGTTGGGTSGGTGSTSGGGSTSSGSQSGSGSSSSTTKSSSSSSTSSSSSSPSTSTTAPAPTATASPTTTTASLGSLSITIVGANGQKVSGAKVILDGSQVAYSNSNGVVSFPGVSGGHHTITVSKNGSQSVTESLATNSGENKLITFKLTSSTSGVPATASIGVSVAVLFALAFGIYYFRFLWPNRSRNGEPLRGVVVGDLHSQPSPSLRPEVPSVPFVAETPTVNPPVVAPTDTSSLVTPAPEPVAPNPIASVISNQTTPAVTPVAPAPAESSSHNGASLEPVVIKPTQNPGSPTADNPQGPKPQVYGRQIPVKF